MLFAFCCNHLEGETISLKEDDDLIKASLVVTGTGDMPYQISGHVAIRMESPRLGLDRMFTFDNNVSNISKFFTQHLEGRVFENLSDEYLNIFFKEDREITSFTLNLNEDEKLRLWEVLDSMKMLPERPFNIIDSHCFSVAAEALDKAVAPAYINWNEQAQKWSSYSEIAKVSGGDNNPWNYLFIMLALGNKGDAKGDGAKFIYPTTFAQTFSDFEIMYPDGTTKPLILSNPLTINTRKNIDKAIYPTPFLASVIFLILVVLVTIMQYLGKWNLVGKSLDIAIWTLTIVGGIIILTITYSPHHYGGNWNWALIVFNPLAWLPIAVFRKNIKVYKTLWMFYAIILLLFAIFIGQIATHIDNSWRIVAFALAIRCFGKYIKNNKLKYQIK